MSYFPDYTAVVTLTPAQIKTLHTAPLLIAPGVAGTIVDVRSIFCEMNPGTAAYVVDAGGNVDVLTLFTGSVVAGVPDINSLLNYAGGIISASGFVDSTTPIATFSFGWWGGNQNSGAQAPASVIVGAGIYIYQHNSNSNFQAGTNWTAGNGTLKIAITYSYIEA
jgi:hypothetical protein